MAQRFGNWRTAVVGVAAMTAIVAAAVASVLWVLSWGNSTALDGQSYGSGGGGAPADDLRGLIESLPFPPGLAANQPPVSTGINAQAAYWVEGAPPNGGLVLCR